MTAADSYAARFDEMARQGARWGAPPPGTDRWAARAPRAAADPRRPLDANLEVFASYVEPDDVVVDVGGGAGAVGLPLALRCRGVVNVDPSPAMRAEFERSAAGAGIDNARFVAAAWPQPDVAGEVVLTRHVTYFVRDIVPFVRGLEAAARRRVVVWVSSPVPPAHGAAIAEAVFGEPQVTEPGHRELLAVLWEMGILPDVRVLPLPQPRTWRWPVQPTRDLMLDLAVDRMQELGTVDADAVRATIAARFDELFARDAEGYAPRWRTMRRDLLITWEPGRGPVSA
ncbi:MAG TPA: methyltransferase domain-containing protein [Chloroflexota bacterium]|nr:methyltransferase domain-containing protein [Chloroflexota bacterium]